MNSVRVFGALCNSLWTWSHLYLSYIYVCIYFCTCATSTWSSWPRFMRHRYLRSANKLQKILFALLTFLTPFTSPSFTITIQLLLVILIYIYLCMYVFKYLLAVIFIWESILDIPRHFVAFRVQQYFQSHNYSIFNMIISSSNSITMK